MHEHLINMPKLTQTEECYGHEKSRVAREDNTFWFVWQFLVQFVLRLLPTVLICSLNTWMYFKLKGLQRHRDKIFGVPMKESSTASNQILDDDPTWTYTIKNRVTNVMFKKTNEDKPLRSVSEIVMKVNE